MSKFSSPHLPWTREISGQQPTQLYKDFPPIGPPFGLDVAASGKGRLIQHLRKQKIQNSLENESLNLTGNPVSSFILSMIFANFVMPWIGLWLSIFESQVLPTSFVSWRETVKQNLGTTWVRDRGCFRIVLFILFLFGFISWGRSQAHDWLAKTPLTPMPFSGTQNSIKDLKSVKPSPVPGVVENSSVVSSSESSSVSSGTGAALVVILVVDVLVVLVILFLVEVMTASVVFAGIVVVLVGLLYVCESSMVSLLSWGKG